MLRGKRHAGQGFIDDPWLSQLSVIRGADRRLGSARRGVSWAANSPVAPREWSVRRSA